MKVRELRVGMPALVGLMACFAALLVPTGAGSATTSGVRYGAHTAEVLDAYAASRTGSPVLVVVHGGGWTKGDKRDVAKTAKPTFIVHSTKDPTVPFSQSQELDARLTGLKIDHTFLHLSGTAHAQEQWAQAEAPTFAWLAIHL
jgi:acetyl esterase/lipase